MTRSKKVFGFHPAVAMAPGLVVAQIIGTLQVYLSNVELYAKMEAISAARFLAIPNQQVMPHLQEIESAICGGLFFTLSVGAGISLFSFAAAWVWLRFSSRNTLLLLLLIAIWVGLLLFINLQGIILLPTLYALFIPPLVFMITLKLMSADHDTLLATKYMIHVVPIFILVGLWFTQYDRYLFLDLRDYLLLSNPVTKKISDFYYSYTLYSAEAFKSQSQKLLKTVRSKDSNNRPLSGSVEKALIHYDYLPVDHIKQTDLFINKENETLSFFHHGRKILQTSVQDFLTDTSKMLNQFSLKNDRYVNFRQITFLSLLFGYPLLLYILSHAIFWVVLELFVGSRKAMAMASIICFIISVGLLIQFHMARRHSFEKDNINRSLHSERWQTRVAALRAIHEDDMEIGNYINTFDAMKSPHIPERYWLAKALAKSRKPDTHGLLLSLVEDPNPNVVSAAFSALAQRQDRRAVKTIIKKIKISKNWYSQVYAYKALRALGWKQTKSH
jgi:hypothetical protein